jgi:hypothetical protein
MIAERRPHGSSLFPVARRPRGAVQVSKGSRKTWLSGSVCVSISASRSVTVAVEDNARGSAAMRGNLVASALTCGAALTGVLSFRATSPVGCVPGDPSVHADGIAGFPASASPDLGPLFSRRAPTGTAVGVVCPRVVVEKARPDRPGGGRGRGVASVRSVAWM